MRRFALACSTLALLASACRRDTAPSAPPEPAPMPSASSTGEDPPIASAAKQADCSAETIDAVVAGSAQWTDEGPVCLSQHEEACKTGDGDACVLASMILLNGIGGVELDQAAAFRLADEACARDVASACLVAGKLHERGTGTEANIGEAATAYQRACELGNEQGCVALASTESVDEAFVPGANLVVASAAADGLELRFLSCKVESLPVMGMLRIVGSLAKQKRALDRCAPKGQAFEVMWTFASGLTKDVTASGGTPKQNACVVKAVSRVAAPFPARCGAVVLAGDPGGAAASMTAVENP